MSKTRPGGHFTNLHMAASETVAGRFRSDEGARRRGGSREFLSSEGRVGVGESLHVGAVRIDGTAGRTSFAFMARLQGKRRPLLSSAAIILGIIAAMSVAVAVLALKYDYLVWDRGKVGMPRLLRQTEVRTDDLPALVEAMSRGSAIPRWATLMFSTPDRPSDQDAVALQVSVENGKAGFEWVLLAPRNIEDQEKFRTFARAHGIEPVAHTTNGVSYLRVEPADVAKFTGRVVTDMYDRPPAQSLALVYEGFDWPQS